MKRGDLSREIGKIKIFKVLSSCAITYLKEFVSIIKVGEPITHGVNNYHIIELSKVGQSVGVGGIGVGMFPNTASVFDVVGLLDTDGHSNTDVATFADEGYNGEIVVYATVDIKDVVYFHGGENSRKSR